MFSHVFVFFVLALGATLMLSRVRQRTKRHVPLGMKTAKTTMAWGGSRPPYHRSRVMKKPTTRVYKLRPVALPPLARNGSGWPRPHRLLPTGERKQIWWSIGDMHPGRIQPMSMPCETFSIIIKNGNQRISRRRNQNSRPMLGKHGKS
jgi:hypothetical protein